MKEKRKFKRFDFFAVLAFVGVLLMLLFESYFVLELYNRDIGLLEQILPAVEGPIPLEESIPVG